jgi:hypothetical protein
MARASLGLGRIVVFAIPLILFIPDSLTYSVPLFLKRQCDRTLGQLRHAPRGYSPGAGLLTQGEARGAEQPPLRPPLLPPRPA